MLALPGSLSMPPWLHSARLGWLSQFMGAGAKPGAKDSLDFFTQQALYKPVLRRETFLENQNDFPPPPFYVPFFRSKRMSF